MVTPRRRPVIQWLSVAALLLQLWILLPHTAVDAQNTQLLSVGQRMPDAEVVDLQGRAINMRSLVGTRPVLVEFWATWCGVCKALKPRLESAKAKYGDRVDFIILAVSVEQARSDVSAYLQANGLPGRPLYDNAGAAMAAFGVGGTGYVFVMDRDGRVTYVGVGATQDIETEIASVLKRESEPLPRLNHD